MKRIWNRARSLREDQGITGLETAIVLIAFVVVAAVFAFVVLSTGLFSSERGKETVYAGLAKTRGTMTLSSSVIGTSDGTELTGIDFNVVLAAGGDAVNLDPNATSNRTVMSYIDNANNVADLTYTASDITGDGDGLLEPGELFTIGITGLGAYNIVENTTFTIEVKPPTGSYLVLQRTTPASVDETIINMN